MVERSTADWEQTKTRPSSGRRSPSRTDRCLGLTILGHPNHERIGEQGLLTGLAQGRGELLSRLEPTFTSDAGHDRPLSDPYLSRRPLQLLPADAGSIRLDCTATSTEVVVNGSSVSEGCQLAREEIAEGVVLVLADSVVLLLHDLQPISAASSFPTLVGQSPEMRQLREEIRRVADLKVPVLIRGETGTGKELVARAIHDAGPRRHKPYLGVNMGAIPPTLGAAELFGAAKGAFTGADRRRMGYFQRADGGTLLLDEIGATPVEIQVMLLRALETDQIEPVGDHDPLTVDVRILAATDTNLEAAIDKGEFRAPLLHRLSSYVISIPPVRHRREDFGRLFYHFLRQELEAIGESHRLERAELGTRPWLPASLVARMATFTWPGNVRQLRNVARQIVIASRGSDEVRLTPQISKLLEEANAPVSGLAATPPKSPEARTSAPKVEYRDPQDVGEEELKTKLRANRWRLKPTASDLGISRTSLYALIERCPEIRQAKDLTREEILPVLERCDGQLETAIEELEVSRDALLRRMKELGLR